MEVRTRVSSSLTQYLLGKVVAGLLRHIERRKLTATSSGVDIGTAIQQEASRGAIQTTSLAGPVVKGGPAPEVLAIDISTAIEQQFQYGRIPVPCSRLNHPLGIGVGTAIEQQLEYSRIPVPSCGLKGPALRLGSAVEQQVG